MQISTPSQYDIFTIKMGFDLQDYAERTLGVERDGKAWRGGVHIPGYGGLYVWPDRWHRFSDGSGGDLLDFVQWAYGCPFREALQIAAGYSTISPTPSPTSTYRPAVVRPAPSSPHGPFVREIERQHVATWTYHDPDWRPLYHTDKYIVSSLYQDGAVVTDKRFFQRPDGVRRAYRGCMDGVRRVPYRLPDLLTAVAHGQPVYIAEGEKDCDTIKLLLREELGQPYATATTTPQGAGSWRRFEHDYTPYFSGAVIVFDGDTDDAGLQYMRAVYRSIRDIVQSVSLTERVADALAERGQSLEVAP